MILIMELIVGNTYYQGNLFFGNTVSYGVQFPLFLLGRLLANILNTLLYK